MRSIYPLTAIIFREKKFGVTPVFFKSIWNTLHLLSGRSKRKDSEEEGDFQEESIISRWSRWPCHFGGFLFFFPPEDQDHLSKVIKVLLSWKQIARICNWNECADGKTRKEQVLLPMLSPCLLTLLLRGAAAYFVLCGRPVFCLSFLAPQRDLKKALAPQESTHAFSDYHCSWYCKYLFPQPLPLQFFCFVRNTWIILGAGPKNQVAPSQGCAPTTSTKTPSPSSYCRLLHLPGWFGRSGHIEGIREVRGWSWVRKWGRTRWYQHLLNACFLFAFPRRYLPKQFDEIQNQICK